MRREGMVGEEKDINVLDYFKVQVGLELLSKLGNTRWKLSGWELLSITGE